MKINILLFLISLIVSTVFSSPVCNPSSALDPKCCSHHGVFINGRCFCLAGYSGPQCEHIGADSATNSKDFEINAF